jgi:type I restriction enzyme S subunit
MTYPPEWPLQPVHSFASIGTGSKNSQDNSASGKYPFFVRSQNIERIDSWSFDGEAVLTAGDGVGTGKVFHYVNGKFDYHQRVYRISDFLGGVSGKYFFYQFSRNFLARIELLTAKSSVDSVRMETIAGMEIPIPPRSEQDRIVVAIDDVSELVQSLKLLIRKKQSIKQGMMQELLSGRTRLPGFISPWKLVRLKSVLQFQVGFPFRSSEFSERPVGPRLVRNRDLRSDDSFVYYAGSYSEDYLVTNGDVLVGMDGDFSPCVWRLGIALLNQRVGRLRVGPNADATYLHYALATPLKEIEAETGATTVKHLSHGDVENIVITLPSVEEQRAIARALLDADIEIEHLSSRLRKTGCIKQGMMQELLTGRTRLPVEVAQ